MDATPQPTALRCPLAGDHLVYLSNDTSVGVTFENQSDHRIYICPSLGYDNANDTFNCQSAVVGLQVVVVSTGLAGTVQCTAGAGTTFGNVGIGLVGGAQACTYLNCRFGN